jgi:hypothetical protein
MAQNPRRGANGRDTTFDTITDAKPVPDGNLLPRGIKRYRSYDGADTQFGEVRDISKQIDKAAKNYRR